MSNLEEATWRGKQGRQERGGVQKTDGSKRAGSRRIAGNGRHPGHLNPGRCGIGV